MFRENSPPLGPTHFATANPPPSPPFSAHNDALDDIYGSAPASPTLTSTNPHEEARPHNRIRADEILSDLPSRQRVLDTDAYREGLSNSKGQFVQQGFDEGYSLGAELGQRVGYVLGVLQGFVNALKEHNKTCWHEARGLLSESQKELAIQELLGQKWVDEEGIWKWEVSGKEEEITLREVADQHPVVKRWMDKVQDVARGWGADLSALEVPEQDMAEQRS